jgi:hypothetical protein
VFEEVTDSEALPGTKWTSMILPTGKEWLLAKVLFHHLGMKMGDKVK